MTKELILEEFAIHFTADEDRYNRVEFIVYPISHWKRLSDNTTGYSYYEKQSSDQLEEFDKDKALKKLEGFYCWRGVWEGRLYFPDEEYWGEELRELADLYEKEVEPWCKSTINAMRVKQGDQAGD